MNKKRKKIVIFIFFVCFIAISLYFRIKVAKIYKDGINQIDNGEYMEAIENLESLGDYKESKKYIDEAQKELKYIEAVELYNERNYAEAKPFFNELGNYKDSEYYKSKCSLETIDDDKEIVYKRAEELFYKGKYDKALDEISTISDYEKSRDLFCKCMRMKLASTIAAGMRYSLAINNDNLVMMACSDKGMTYDFSQWDDIISISGLADVILGLTIDGKVNVTTSSYFEYDYDVSEWNNIIQIATGDSFAVALTDEGKVLHFGRNHEGQCNVDEWENIVQITTAHRLTVGLDSDGNLHFAGLNSKELMNEYEKNKSQWKNVEFIQAAGGDIKRKGHVIGLRTDGKVVALGDKFEISESKIEDLDNISMVAVGDNHIIAITKDEKGKIVGDPGILDYHSKSQKEKIDEWPYGEIIEIQAGLDLTLAVTSSGEIYAAGNEKQGQMGANGWSNALIINRE